MKGELLLVDEIMCDEEEFSMSIASADFSLCIYVDKEKTLEKQLKNKETFKKCMNYEKEIDEMFGNTPKKDREYVEKNFDYLLDSVEYIRLNFETNLEKDFIKNNPMILTKKIVLNECLKTTDYDKVIMLLNEYEEIIDSIYVNFEDNNNYVSLIDCYKTINAIKKQADEIANLKMSPIETIMYVYDQVRNRVYTSENSNETAFKSRDLSEVLFGDKIVCVGYANMFHATLSNLGIENHVVDLDRKEINSHGHARNVIYVKDKKYNIDGVYYFDPTWDSKRKENDNTYLYSYKCFLKTKDQMEKNENYEFIDTKIPMYSEDLYEQIESIIKSGEYYKLSNYVQSINYMTQIVEGNPLIKIWELNQIDEKSFLEKCKKIISKFKQEISAETMICLLKNVRKIEYYQNPKWYPYSRNDLGTTTLISDWEFKKEHLDQNERLINSIFEMDKIRYKKINFINYSDEIEIAKEIEQVKFTKVLQKTLKNKMK